MPITPSQRPTREWPLLVLALALVCTVCFFLWGWFGGHEMGGTSVASWTHERLSRLLLGPEQIACYSFFTWAAFIVLSRYLEVRRQRKGFQLGFLPTEEGSRILPEDARPLQRRLDQLSARRGPFILANMVRL